MLERSSPAWPTRRAMVLFTSPARGEGGPARKAGRVVCMSSGELFTSPPRGEGGPARKAGSAGRGSRKVLLTTKHPSPDAGRQRQPGRQLILPRGGDGDLLRGRRHGAAVQRDLL